MPAQVIEVPKISQDSIPQRTLLSEPQQLVEQLVEVLVTSPRDCVITATLREVVLARFWGTDGLIWCQCPEPRGSCWWLAGTRHTVVPPGGTHRQLRTGYKYWANLTRVRFRPLLMDVPVIMPAQVPVVRPRQWDGASESVPRQSARHSSCNSEMGTHSAKLSRRL